MAVPAGSRFRILAVGLLVVAGCVNYMDRSALSVGNLPISQELGLNPGQTGLLLSMFALSYGLAQIPAGVLVDRLGPKRVLGGAMVLWSVAQVGAGLVTAWPPFAAARLALGLGESPMYTGGVRVCSDWFEPPRRGLPIGLLNASSALGPAIAPALLTLLMVAAGWRAMFVAIGVLGLAVAIAWLAIYRDPPVPAAAAGDAPILVPSRATFAMLLRQRAVWGLVLSSFGVVYVTWLFGTWLPAYLEGAQHMSLTEAGLWSSVPQTAGFVGAVLGGLLADRLTRAGLSPLLACKLPLIVGLVLTAGCVAAASGVTGANAAILLFCGALFCANLASSAGWALGAVVAPAGLVATVEGIQNVGGSIGGFLAPAVTGYVRSATGSFAPALQIAAALALVSAGLCWALVRHPVESA